MHAFRSISWRTLAAIATWVAAIAALYGRVFIKLGHDWIADDSYSHGWLVLPIAAWLVWRQRERLQRTPVRPAALGLFIVIASLVIFAGGSLAAELFTTRVSLIGVVAGTVVFVYGWRHLRIVAFPLAFLLFMIPLPSLVFDPMTQSLQLVASGLGERLLRASDYAVIRDGNVLTLSSITLQVTDACSGIRSLMSLLMVTSLIAYFFEPTQTRRLLLTLTAVPLAIVLNGLRVAFTGIAASRFGPAMARGFLHETSGWVVFMAAFGAIWMIHQALHALGARRRTPLLVEAA
jgi:exosortase